ncbi:HD domain-containing protein [Sulfuracidifex tepidarius]|uniref:5'-deoxynucleotidase n=1 Tax=Sulfuracidifex tepidarius TaxID=1294262 RepID=A0A510E695_9CREN|nr:HD family hydrolase [Sulfuracidifex tepidarius]BBG25235.1 hypothetical protein IC006_2570 [Sulfuracidifex tepidarius]BBG28029.1 hypothetical protein IC007_2584 [Sulfuracidifex tepidarius]
MMIRNTLSACKNLVRTGWMQCGVPPTMGDTVASHSFEAAVIAYYISEKLREMGVQVNSDHAASIALFHDLGESLLGDLPKWASLRLDKREAEKEAFREIGIGEGLFAELKEGTTLEAKVAKLSDRLSTSMEANRLMKRGYDVGKIIETYIPEINKMLDDPFLSKVKNIVLEMLDSTTK